MVLIRKPSPTSGCAVGKRDGVIVMGNSSNFNVKIIDREKTKVIVINGQVMDKSLLLLYYFVLFYPRLFT